MRKVITTVFMIWPLFAEAATGGNDDSLSIWQALLPFIPLLLIAAVGFAIYKAIVAAKQSTVSTAPAAFSDQRTKKFCTDCGAEISVRAEICPKCGVRQPLLTSYGANPSHGRSKLAAALFALFLGGLGIHKFYLGRIGQGVLYLLFCWTFLPAIIGFIEGLVYLSMSDQAFAARYGAA